MPAGMGVRTGAAIIGTPERAIITRTIIIDGRPEMCAKIGSFGLGLRTAIFGIVAVLGFSGPAFSGTGLEAFQNLHTLNDYMDAARARDLNNAYMQMQIERQQQEMQLIQLQNRRQAVLEFNMQGAAAVRSRLPMKVDSTTTLVSVEGTPDSLNYTYKVAANKNKIHDLEARFRPALVESVCGSPDLRPAIEAGDTFIYNYEDRHGAVVTSVAVTKADCV
jgi:hypothetical protein